MCSAVVDSKIIDYFFEPVNAVVIPRPTYTRPAKYCWRVWKCLLPFNLSARELANKAYKLSVMIAIPTKSAPSKSVCPVTFPLAGSTN